MKTELIAKIRELINRECEENESNTPDFMLAEYLVKCLDALNSTIRQRESWYGRNPDKGPGE